MKSEICPEALCSGCEVCVQVCPVHCITMRESAEGFFYPTIDESKCVNCQRCRATCPNNKTMRKNSGRFYMGWHKNLEVLRNSSSGGAFTALAEIILEKNGVVYGACFDAETREVRHVAVEKLEDLQRIRLSKYYQSRPGDIYAAVKEALKNRWVLFSGTACQIAALYSYLGKDYDNLLTVDILCHGVASKKVVDEYIKSEEKRFKKKIINYKFRVKPDDSDWLSGGGTRMRLDFADGTHLVVDKSEDIFFIGFNRYLFVRKSCYQCKYTGTARVADFTLADYWGVPLEEISEQERKYGVSLILANSPKAQSLLEEVDKRMVMREIDPALPVAHNQALVKPSTVNPAREKFFAQLGKIDFDYLVHICCWKFYAKRKTRQIAKYLLGEKTYKKIVPLVKKILNYK